MTAAIRNCSLSMRHIQLQYFLYIKTFNLHRTPYAMVSHSVMSDSLQAHVLYPTGLLCAWNSPGKNTGVGSCSLLQGIFPTSNNLPIKISIPLSCGLPWWLSSKESACNARDLGSISGLERSPGEGNSYPLQYSYPENPMDRGPWRATDHGVTKIQE